MRVSLREANAGRRKSIDVRRSVSHHAAVAGTDVPVSDIVAPDDEDAGFVRRLRGKREAEA